MQAVSISEARKRLFALRQQVVDDHESIILTHKKGNIVMISMDEWESYQETYRILNDKETLKALLQSFEDRKNGCLKSKSMGEIFSDV